MTGTPGVQAGLAVPDGGRCGGILGSAFRGPAEVEGAGTDWVVVRDRAGVVWFAKDLKAGDLPALGLVDDPNLVIAVREARAAGWKLP